MENILTREQLMEKLASKYPGLFLRNSEDFGKSAGGIWTGSDDPILAKDGFEVFDYYAQVSSKAYHKYGFGIHNEIGQIIDQAGWFVEWYDPGTLIISIK